MRITLTDGSVVEHVFTLHAVTGYRARSIEIDALDVEQMRVAAELRPEEFQTAMRQLEARFERQKEM